MRCLDPQEWVRAGMTSLCLGREVGGDVVVRCERGGDEGDERGLEVVMKLLRRVRCLCEVMLNE